MQLAQDITQVTMNRDRVVLTESLLENIPMFYQAAKVEPLLCIKNLDQLIKTLY